MNTTLEEKFIFTISTTKDDLAFYIPLHGFSVKGTRNARYNWEINWGDGTTKKYVGLSSTSKLLSHKTIIHNLDIYHNYKEEGQYKITIRPLENKFGWMRAWGFGSSFGTFNFYNNYTLDYSNNSNKITSFDYVTNKSFMESETSYGIGYMRHICCGTEIINPIKEIKTVSEEEITIIKDYFKAHQYKGCKKLLISEEEQLSNNITIIGNYYRSAQYDACMNLLIASNEYLPDTVTTIGNNFRAAQFDTCINLHEPAKEYVPDNVNVIGDWFRAHQYKNCTNLKYPAVESIPDNIRKIGDSYRALQYNRTNLVDNNTTKSYIDISGINYKLKQFGYDTGAGYDVISTKDTNTY